MVKLPDGAIVERELMHRGSAVAVLPYDPVRRMVMLITQPRPGALFHGLPSPFEVIAGCLDDADPAERIVDEAMEDAKTLILAQTLLLRHPHLWA